MEPEVTSLSDLRRFTSRGRVSAQAQLGEKMMLKLVEPARGAIVRGLRALIREHDRALAFAP